MQKLKILNSKEKKEMMSLLENAWGFSGVLPYVFFQSEKGKLYLVNDDFSRLHVEKLRVNSLGMYFGELKDGSFRLSIEGSQIIGKHCSRNVVLLDNEQMYAWMHGETVVVAASVPDGVFVLVQHGEDFLGCGKYRDGKILNFVPKERRIG